MVLVVLLLFSVLSSDLSIFLGSMRDLVRAC